MMREFIEIKGNAIVRDIPHDSYVGDIKLSTPMIEKIGKKINLVAGSVDGTWYISDDIWLWHFTWLKYIKAEFT